MPIPTRESPFLAYLLVHATMLRGRRDVTSGAAERLEKRAQALELLAELVRAVPEDDERLLMLATLAVRHGQFVPGPAAEHALTQFAGTSREACDAIRDASDERLCEQRVVNNFNWTGIQAVVRSVAHFRGHTQEIIHITRTLLGDGYQFAGPR